MAKHPTRSQRTAWFRWHAIQGANVSATCAHFGIARSTFYRWQRRQDAREKRIEEARLRRLLGMPKPPPPPAQREARWRRALGLPEPQARGRPRQYWTEINLSLVSRLDMLHPRWGRRAVHAEMAAHGFPMSEATIGRMLAVVRARCPVCEGRGLHNPGLHALERDIWRNLGGRHPSRS